jgi:hypothetical protein
VQPFVKKGWTSMVQRIIMRRHILEEVRLKTAIEPVAET